jgi:hypothetical protein
MLVSDLTGDWVVRDMPRMGLLEMLRGKKST